MPHILKGEYKIQIKSSNNYLSDYNMSKDVMMPQTSSFYLKDGVMADDVNSCVQPITIPQQPVSNSC